MGKVILFSPVGGTDPISNYNGKDGALLHCCRVKQPDMIYMYMSKMVVDNENEDQRYSYCLTKLYEMLGKKLFYKRIDRPELEDVHEFDYFYDDFLKEIKRIMKTMDKQDELYINTSSGTPAMKAALVVLVSLGKIDATLLQVTTPNEKLNIHDNRNYDVKALWEANPDNLEGFKVRCKPINCPSIVRMQNEELIKKLIRSYDYVAALEVANSMLEKHTENYKYLIEYANFRLKLDKESMDRIEAEHKFADYLLPKRNPKRRDITEYALSLFIKKMREEYADFIRGLTPLILKLYILVLRNEGGIDIYKFSYSDPNAHSVVWSEKKLRDNEEARSWLEIWRKRYGNDFRPAYIYSDSLLPLIENYCSPDTYACANRLREVERSIRNIAAHETSLITEERVKEITGFSCDEIISDIKQLFKCSGIDMKDKWNSYDQMNKYIIKRIGV